MIYTLNICFPDDTSIEEPFRGRSRPIRLEILSIRENIKPKRSVRIYDFETGEELKGNARAAAEDIFKPEIDNYLSKKPLYEF